MVVLKASFNFNCLSQQSSIVVVKASETHLISNMCQVCTGVSSGEFQLVKITYIPFPNAVSIPGSSHENLMRTINVLPHLLSNTWCH